jgi:hypothetical protein
VADKTAPAPATAADPVAAKIASLQEQYAAELAERLFLVKHPRCTSLIEGTVVSITPVPAFQDGPAGDHKNHVYRAITIEVAESYRKPHPALVTVYAHGGFLDPADAKSAGPGMPAGCSSSADLDIEVGQTVLLSLIEDHPHLPFPAQVFGGPLAALDLVSPAATVAGQSVPLDSELQAVAEEEKTKLVDAVMAEIAGEVVP